MTWERESERLGVLPTCCDRLISRTRAINASSTLIRSFADVSMNAQPNLRARFRASVKTDERKEGRISVMQVHSHQSERTA